MNAPVQFTWVGHDGEPKTGRGVTRDVTTFGAYIVADALPSVGALMQLEIALPKVAQSPSGMCLHGEGVVLRTESSASVPRTGAGHGGFAATMQFYPESTDSVASHFENSVQGI